MRFLPLFAILLLTNSLFGQVPSEATTPYALTGLAEPIVQYDNLLLVGQKSKPILTPIGLIVLNTEVTKASVSAGRWTGTDWRIITARLVSKPAEVPLAFAIEEQGSWLVFVSGDKVDIPLFSLNVGEAPPPPPPPPPPPGDFTELANRSKTLALALNDPPTAKMLSEKIAAVQAGSDLTATRYNMRNAVDEALHPINRKGASRDKDWYNGWQLPVSQSLQALMDSGITTSEVYLQALKALSLSLKAQ